MSIAHQDHFTLSGIVQHGKKEARKMDFPTANIVCSEESLSRLKEGIYAAMAHIPSHSDSPFLSVAYIKDGLLEVHVLDSHMDLYDQYITVNLVQFIRSPVPFISLDAMRIQIEKDIQVLNEYCHDNIGDEFYLQVPLSSSIV